MPFHSKPEPKISFDFRFSKVLAAIFLFAFTFLIPAYVYTEYSPDNIQNRASRVAGAYTDSYYSMVEDNRVNSGFSINWKEPKFNLLTLGLVGAGTVFLASVVFIAYEKHQSKKYASPEL